MRIAIAQIGVQLAAFVRFVVSVRVLKIPDVWRGADNDAILVKHTARGQLDLVCKDLLLVHDAVTVRVGKNADLIKRFAFILSGLNRPAILPRIHVRLPQPIRILRRLNHPQTPLLIPVDVHRLVDERLSSHQREIELRMHFERIRQLLRARATALNVTQRITQLGRFAQLVDVLTLPSPGDAAQDHRSHGVVAEVLVPMTRDASKGAILLLFISPHLRLDVINVHRFLLRHGFGGTLLRLFVSTFDLRGVRCVGGCQNFGLGQQIHVVVNLVVDIKVADVLGDRILTIGEVEAHRGLQPLRGAFLPRAADDVLEPVMIAGDRSRVNRHHTTATGQELHQMLPLFANLDVARFLRVQDEHVRAIKLLLRREFEAALALRTALIEHRHPVLEELRVIMGTGTV